MLVEDLWGLDYTFETWNPKTADPALQLVRAGEGFERTFPYIAVDFLPTSRAKFKSISDVLGFEADPDHYKYGYCELEMVSICVYANDFHNNYQVRGRDFCDFAIRKIHEHILSKWEEKLLNVNACLERSINIPIRDITAYLPQAGTKQCAYELDVFLRTNVQWNKLPEGFVPTGVVAEEATMYLENVD